jgi:hypothetical protein
MVSDLVFSSAVSSLFLRCFFAVILAPGCKKARVSAGERGMAAVFFRHYQRHQRSLAPNAIARVLNVFMIPSCLLRGVAPYKAQNIPLGGHL